ncbi:phosphatidylglycerol lysyltransferase domain-containing protein [uncultured Tateyamaria sp.]|uniref:phosphatidylglycerol lysyltransferase domain-containing protein n=1 Tax=uncultured Tateyamaria sp. TaxID=455651 RepID=UPI002609ECF0|nr:phosphatidylglycerol lysyltransferase domain-containing protein [uncultured Tateyamaria sp.]
MPSSRALSVAQVGARVGVPIVIFLGCAMILSRQVPSDILLTLPAQLAGIASWQWGLAAVFTAGSFFAVAQYDVQAHRALGTKVPDGRARITGAVGIAIGQTVGFGLVSGALARWRMLPELNVGQALKLSTMVSLSFVIAWACLTGLVCLVLPAPVWTSALSVGALVLVPGLAALLFFRPTLTFGSRAIHLPSLRISASILGWALVDMAMAAATLWVLLPAGTMPFVTLLPLFMIALGCGLMSNTPGGVGPFELVLVTAIPVGTEAEVLAGILAFRAVYYALPALCAMLAMLRPLTKPKSMTSHPAHWHDLPSSEAQALRQNDGCVEVSAAGGPVAIWSTSQTRTLFTDPGNRANARMLSWLQRRARSQGRIPLIYKSGARLAHAARRAQWAVLHIADDAIIDVKDYTLDVPARRRLRRKLRAVTSAGVTLRSGCAPPLKDAERLDAQWQAQCGSARGGSMGRYCPDYVSDQWVVSAYSDTELIGFASFHRGASDWCLDIMRHAPDAPDGTMHALVHHAIQDAHAEGFTRVSLASVIACPNGSSAFWRWAAQKALIAAGGSGLRQFKSAFAPRWVPRYAAAPTWLSMIIGMADIARVIRNPIPLAAPKTSPAHHQDENYELASHSAA